MKNSETRPGISRLKKVAVIITWVLLVTLTIVVTFLTTLSWTTPYITHKYLQSKGYSFEVKNASINAFRGKVELEDISFNVGKENENMPNSSAQLLLQKLVIDLGIQDLILNQEITLSRIHMEGAFIPAVKIGDQYQIADYVFGSSEDSKGDPSNTSNNNDSESNSENSVSAPIVKWSAINLKDINLTITDSTGEKPVLTVTLEKLNLGAFSTNQAAKKTPFELELTHAESSILAKGSTSLVAPTLDGQASITLKKITSEFATSVGTFLPNSEKINKLFEHLTANISYQSSATWTHSPARTGVQLLDATLDMHNFELSENSNNTLKTIKANGLSKFDSLEYSSSLSSTIITAFTLNDAAISLTELFEGNTTEVNFSELQLTLDKLNSAEPQQKSKLNLTSKLGRFGTIVAKGSSTLLEPGHNTEFEIKTEQINLLALSPLLARTINRSISSGQLSGHSSIKIGQHKINAQNDLQLDQFKLATLETDKNTDPLALGIPMNTALNLLRDKNDRIKLSLPVSGSLDDPEFSLQPTVNKALLNSIKTAVITQVGPLLAISALNKARNLKDALSLKPLRFASGSTELEKDALDNIKRLVTLMNNRQKISIRLCPIYTAEEVVSQTTQKSDTSIGEKLSTDRFNTVKEVLISSGISGHRIVECAAEIGTNDSEPRIQPNF